MVDNDVACESSTPPPPVPYTRLIVVSPPLPPPSSRPSKMDNEDSILAGFRAAECVLDKALNDFYDKNARGDSAIIVDLDDNSDDPPFEHDAPSAPRCLLGNKRSFPLPWTEQNQPPLKATSATINLVAKNAISPNSFTYLGFTYTSTTED